MYRVKSVCSSRASYAHPSTTKPSLWITCPEQLEFYNQPAGQQINSADMLSNRQQAPFQLDHVC